MAGFSGCDESILYLSSKKEESQKAFSIYSTMTTSGLLFASLIYTVFIGENYRRAGLLTAVSYGVAAILAFGLEEVPRADEKKDSFGINCKEGIKAYLNPNLILLLIAIACLEQTHQTVTVFLNQLLYIRSGISTNLIGIIYIIVNLIGFVGIFSHKLTIRIGEKKLIGILYGIAAISCIALALLINPIISVIGIVLLRMIFSLFNPLQMEIQNREIITSDRATALSINSILLNGIGTATNVIFGRMADISLTLAMVFGAILCLFGCIMFISWYKRK